MDKMLRVISDIKDWFRELNVKDHFRTVFTVLAVASVAYAAADTAVNVSRLVIPGPRPQGKSPQREQAAAARAGAGAYNGIIERNMFGSSMKPSLSGSAQSASDYTGAQTSLHLELLGTIADRQGQGYAIIEEKDRKKQSLFKVGDKVAGATVKEVRRNVVVLRVGAADEYLQMRATPSEPLPPGGDAAAQQRPAPSVRSVPNAPQPGQQQSGPEHAAAREVRDMVADGSVRPHFNAGKMEGFYINKLKDGSVLKRAGLEDGDIVQSVNDRKIENPNDVIWIQKIMSSPGEKVSVQVNRRGRQVSLNIN